MLTSGSRLGAYEILSSIGAGGMGEVFRARDLKLAREVAIKVLPDAFASDQERLLRFQREAQLLASVSHPNIAGIFGLEESNGVTALVLELVPGETLADRVARGPIPIDDALAIASQVASGVDAAHELGIIHRDLKPANIKVTPDGTVKVLDFGLAKLTDRAGAATHPSSVSLSPTITSPALTNVGMILGTAAYMSPEQAKGRPADRRSDVWAFGCLLYEMLTGRRAFDGEDVPETMAAVLRAEPDWTALPHDVPPPIRTLLQRCIAKDRRARPSGMAAVLFVLDEHPHFAVSGGVDERALHERVSAVQANESARYARRTRIQMAAFAGLAAVLAVLAALATWYAMRPAVEAVTRLGLTIGSGPEPGRSPVSNDVAITPDGLHVVYFAGTREQLSNSLAVRSLGQQDAVPLKVDRALGPFVSPDGQWIGFVDPGDRSLKKVSIQGGPEVPIVPGVGAVRGASWARDDRIIYSPVADPGLWRVPAAGGPPTQLTKPGGVGRETHEWPHVLPDGRHVLFTIMSVSLDDARIAVLDLETKTHRVVIPSGTYPRYAKTGHIVYASGGTLFAVGFDLSTLAVTTSPMPMVEGVTVKESGAANFDLSDNGTLVYMPGESRRGERRVAWLDRQGTISAIAALPPSDYRTVHLNRDATQVVFESGPAGNGDVSTFDLQRGTRNVLTSGNDDDRGPVWAPDQQRIVFGSNRDGAWGVFAVSADGSGAVGRLGRFDSAVELWPFSWSLDGRLAFSANMGGDGDIGILTPGTAAIDWRLRTPEIEGAPAVSPNGRWVSYSRQAGARAEIFLERFPGFGDRRPVSADGGQVSLWSRDGRQLYYLDRTRTQIMVVDVTYGRGDQIQIGKPRGLVKAAIYGGRGWRAYDVAPDGRFIIVTADTETLDSRAMPMVEQNWFEELRRKVPVN